MGSSYTATRELNSLGMCSKYLLFIMNLIFFLVGCVMVGVGIWILLERNYASAIFGSHLMTAAAYIIIVGGGLVIIISFCGCVGAVQEIPCLLMTYFVAVLIIFLFLVVAGCLALIFRTQVGEEVIGRMESTLQKDYGVHLDKAYNRYLTEAWDNAQKHMYCCSVRTESWNTYRGSEWYKVQPGIPQFKKPFVPESCCVRDQYGDIIDKDKCQTWVLGPPGKQNGDTNEAVYYLGCYYEGKKYIWRFSAYLAGIGLGIGLSMVAGMAFSIILYLQLSRK